MQRVYRYNLAAHAPRGPVKPVFSVHGLGSQPNPVPRTKNIPLNGPIERVNFLHVGSTQTGSHSTFRHVNNNASEAIFNYGPPYEMKINDRWKKIETGELVYIPQSKPHGPIRLGPAGYYNALNVELVAAKSTHP